MFTLLFCFGLCSLEITHLQIKQIAKGGRGWEEIILNNFSLHSAPKDSASTGHKNEKGKEILPFDDPVCITLEYFRYVYTVSR